MELLYFLIQIYPPIIIISTDNNINSKNVQKTDIIIIIIIIIIIYNYNKSNLDRRLSY
jgi:hypothetical protein